MTALRYLAAVLVSAAAIAGGGHARANTCQANPLICPTAMPIDGYCECMAHGAAYGGTVTATLAPDQHYNAAGGGCGAEPNAAGCRPIPMSPTMAAPVQPPPQPPPPMPPPG